MGAFCSHINPVLNMILTGVSTSLKMSTAKYWHLFSEVKIGYNVPLWRNCLHLCCACHMQNLSRYFPDTVKVWQLQRPKPFTILEVLQFWDY